MRRLVATTAITLFFCAGPQAAQMPPYYGEADCRIAPVEPAPTGDFVKWSGTCKDGYADGPGVLEWNAQGKGKHRLEATLARGEVSGEGTLIFKQGKYIGTFKRGVPHGQGFFEYADGDGFGYADDNGWYEGGVIDGERDGAGILIAVDRSRYEGQWKAGKRHGYGSETFAVGGSYQGEWANDRFEGKGSVVYAGSGRRSDGQFVDGRPVGAPQAPADNTGRFRLRGDELASASKLRRTTWFVGNVPFDLGWDALTEGQKNLLRETYPGPLEPGDDPPFPLEGQGKLHGAIKLMYQNYLEVMFHEDRDALSGPLTLHLLVGKDGTPKSVTAFGGPHPELIRYASMILMATKFRPGVCHGQECEMIFPVRYKFTLD